MPIRTALWKVTAQPTQLLEAVLPSEELDANPTVKDAWNKFQMVARLTNVTLDQTY